MNRLLVQMFEWWYFRKYGTSFIEQVSLNHLSPWLGGGGNGDNADNNSNNHIKAIIRDNNCL
jgi:hypothetical protein